MTIDFFLKPCRSFSFFSRRQRCFFSLLVSFATAFIPTGCGPEGSAPSSAAPTASSAAVNRAPRGESSGETPAASATEGSSPETASAATGSNPTLPNHLARINALQSQIEGGANPKTVEILYAALNDPEPKVRQQVEEWLHLLAQSEPEMRERIEKLHGRERNPDLRRRVDSLLAPPAEPVYEAPPEEADGGNG